MIIHIIIIMCHRSVYHHIWIHLVLSRNNCIVVASQSILSQVLETLIAFAVSYFDPIRPQGFS